VLTSARHVNERAQYHVPQNMLGIRNAIDILDH